MAGTAGLKGSFKLGNAAANSLTDITQYTTQVGLRRVRDQLEASTLGDEDKEHVSGQRSFTLPLSGNFNPTADALFNDDLGKDERSWEYGPEGTQSSKVKYSGKCNLSGYDLDQGAGGLVTFSVTLQGTGAVTRGTY